MFEWLTWKLPNLLLLLSAGPLTKREEISKSIMQNKTNFFIVSKSKQCFQLERSMSSLCSLLAETAHFKSINSTLLVSIIHSHLKPMCYKDVFISNITAVWLRLD